MRSSITLSKLRRPRRSEEASTSAPRASGGNSLAVIDGQYDKLIQMLENTLYEEPDNKRLIDLYNEWTTLFSKLDGKTLTDELMESVLLYRYARMSQAAKCWKFRNDLHTWQEKYGALRPQSDMTEEEIKQAESYRGKCYRYPKDATKRFKLTATS